MWLGVPKWLKFLNISSLGSSLTVSVSSYADLLAFCLECSDPKYQYDSSFPLLQVFTQISPFSESLPWPTDEKYSTQSPPLIYPLVSVIVVTSSAFQDLTVPHKGLVGTISELVGTIAECESWTFILEQKRRRKRSKKVVKGKHSEGKREDGSCTQAGQEQKDNGSKANGCHLLYIFFWH